jgi:myo-inositol 2-dehydrogenase/D-chiro-inositol 1-dehydrogenase
MLRVGVIGLGHMGQLHLLNALRIDEVKVVAGADKSKRNRKKCEQYHINTYDDYTKLIDAEELDAVIISLPNFLKKDSVFYAAENDLGIFLDKPMARNLNEAQEIAKKVEKENVRLLVGVNYRYFPCVQKLKKNFDEGRLGDPVIATADLILNGPLSHGAVPAPVPEWWLNKETAGGGALLDLGYHLLDLLTWMVGDLEVTHSTLKYELNLPVEDCSTVVLESKNSGTTCVINAGWFSKSIFPEFNFRINIHGAAGFDSTDRHLPSDIRYHAVKEGLYNILRRVLLRKPNYLTYTYYYSSFYTLMSLFFEAIRNGNDFPVSVKSELDVIKIIDTVYNQNKVK